MIIANLQVSNTSGKYDRPSRVTVADLEGNRLAYVELPARSPLTWIRRNPDSPEAGSLLRQLHAAGVDEDAVEAIMTCEATPPKPRPASLAKVITQKALNMAARDPLYRAWFGLTVAG